RRRYPKDEAEDGRASIQNGFDLRIEGLLLGCCWLRNVCAQLGEDGCEPGGLFPKQALFVRILRHIAMADPQVYGEGASACARCCVGHELADFVGIQLVRSKRAQASRIGYSCKQLQTG